MINEVRNGVGGLESIPNSSPIPSLMRFMIVIVPICVVSDGRGIGYESETPRSPLTHSVLELLSFLLKFIKLTDTEFEDCEDLGLS
jgi:hypothetical protein